MKKIIKFIIIVIVLIIVLIAFIYNLIDYTENNQNEENMGEKKDVNILMEEEVMDNEEISINVIVNNKIYTATLYNNETVKELITHFPMTLDMNELNSNEKYHYLDFKLITNSYIPNQINIGDIKLYGNDCLVVFYKNFNSSYNYTDLGKIDDVEGFVSELGDGNVILRFELN